MTESEEIYLESLGFSANLLKKLDCPHCGCKFNAERCSAGIHQNAYTYIADWGSLGTVCGPVTRNAVTRLLRERDIGVGLVHAIYGLTNKFIEEEL